MADSRRIDVGDITVADDRVTFAVTNASDEKVYDIIKLYVGETYIGFDYLDLDPGERRSVTFDIANVDVDDGPTTILTTHNREDGVVFESPFDDLSAAAESDAASDDGEEPAEESGQDEARPGQGSGPEEGRAPPAEPREPKEPDEAARPDEVEEMVAARGEEDAEEEAAEETHHGYVSSLMGSLFGGGSETPPEEDEEEEGSDEDQPEEEHVRRAMDSDQIEGQRLPSEEVDRVSTGIIDLDDKMQGGLVEGTMNLVTGKTGTGKTAFCATYLKRGADLDEPGVYVTTEERKEDIRADIQAMFGWDIEELEEQGKIKVMSIKPIFPSKEIENLNRLVRSYITDLLDNVKQAIEELDADRVVIDSVSIIEMFIRDEYMARVALSSLLNSLREADVTAVLTGTVPETSEGLSGGGIIEFLVDTVILLEFVPVAEEHKRTLTIRKMRRTNHAVDIFPFEITTDGLRVYPPR